MRTVSVAEMAHPEKSPRTAKPTTKLKQIKFSLSVDPRDFAAKQQQCVDFLSEGFKVRISVRFSGWKLAQGREWGFALLERFSQGFAPYGHPVGPPKFIGKSVTELFTPLPFN